MKLVTPELLAAAMSIGIVAKGGGFVEIAERELLPGELKLDAAVRLVYAALPDQPDALRAAIEVAPAQARPADAALRVGWYVKGWDADRILFEEIDEREHWVARAALAQQPTPAEGEGRDTQPVAEAREDSEKPARRVESTGELGVE